MDDTEPGAQEPATIGATDAADPAEPPAQGIAGPSGATPPTSGPEAAAARLAADASSGPMRWPISLIMMGVVLFLLAIGLWWVQDAVGTVVNEGEADIGQVVTFQAGGGQYRLLSSGPLRPNPGSTWCDITTSDGKTRREVGGQGLQTGHLGVDRLLTFHPPAGETTVRCTQRGSAHFGEGRFQVIEVGGPTAWAPWGVLALGLLSITAGAAWAWAVVVRSRRN